MVKKTWLEIDASVTSSVGFQTPLNTPLCAFILQLNKEIQNCHTAQPSWNYLLGPYSERQILLLLSSVFACLFCKPLCSFHCGECMLRHSISIFSHGDCCSDRTHWPHLSVAVNKLHMSSVWALSVKWWQTDSALPSLPFLLSTCLMFLNWLKALNVLYAEFKVGGDEIEVKVRQRLARKLLKRDWGCLSVIF